MYHESTSATTAVAAAAREAPATEAAPAWEARLYAGLTTRAVPPDVHTALVRALGSLGVEAEFFLRLQAAFPAPNRPLPAQGETFLRQLEIWAQRLLRVGVTLEVATQGYLAALRATFPDLTTEGEQTPWWPEFVGYRALGEPLELRLRRCGFAYRHVVEVRLASHIEAIAERLALIVHALSTLPPAGVLPASAVHSGLDEIAATVQGELIPHHILDVRRDAPGLLSGIAQLRQLAAQETTSVESDIAWAQGQLAQIYAVAGASHAEQPTRPGGVQTAQQWAITAMQEWRHTVAQLEALRAAPSAPLR